MRLNKRTLLLSLVTLCVSTMLIVGATFALFTGEVTVNNHLSAGNLEVGLLCTSYKYSAINEKGFLEESGETLDEAVDLTKENSAIFTVVDAVPTSWYKAEIEVSNIGTTAFDYGMRIIWNANDNQEDNDVDLADQILITVESTKLPEPVSFKLSEAKDHDIKLGYLIRGAKGDDAEKFTVTAEFVNDDDINNSAMLATLEFDVQVYATQRVSQ